MASNRKYPEVKGYWVYVIYIPSIAKFYVGVSKRKCNQRWQKSKYKDMALEPYLNEWELMEKTVIKDGLTREEALKKEDEFIQELRLKDLCINSKRSGLIEVNDKNAYAREKQKKYNKQRYESDVEYREREIQRVKQWQKDNREKKNEYQRERYQKKKLEKLQQQQTQLNLF